jgi:hypothetical protein
MKHAVKQMAHFVENLGKPTNGWRFAEGGA